MTLVQVLHRTALATSVLLTASILGCGSGNAHVAGVLKKADGSPLAGARVIAKVAEGKAWASGVTDAQGKFSLGRERAGDGLEPGTYQVSITEEQKDWDHPTPPSISKKYASPTTSGLNFDATAGSAVNLELTLDAP